MGLITLNETEQRLAKFIAACRYVNSRKNNIKDAKIGPQSCDETDLEGIAAEIAFCKLHNLYPDTEIGSYAYADCYSVHHGAVDVKTTKYKNGHLIVRKSKLGNEPDSYALMIGVFPEYRYVGSLSSNEILKCENLKDFGYGKSYAVGQERLNEGKNTSNID